MSLPSPSTEAVSFDFPSRKSPQTFKKNISKCLGTIRNFVFGFVLFYWKFHSIDCRENFVLVEIFKFGVTIGWFHLAFLPLPLNRQTLAHTHMYRYTHVKHQNHYQCNWFHGSVVRSKLSKKATDNTYTRRRLKRIGIQLCAIFAVEVIVVATAGLGSVVSWCVCMSLWNFGFT